MRNLGHIIIVGFLAFGLAVFLLRPDMAVTEEPSLSASKAATTGLPDRVHVFHDDARKATCWFYVNLYGAAMSCLPDIHIEADRKG